MKKLSIVIPLYNIDIKYLKECLDSCINNEDIEVIIVDDGSKIDYSTLISKYDYKYIKTVNGGVSQARNIGVLLSIGEYITFLDSDDLLCDIHLILDEINNDDIILFKNYILKNKLIEDKNKIPSGIISSNILKRDIFVLEDRTINNAETVWAKCYKKDFLDKNKLVFKEKLRRSEDVIYNYEAFSCASSIRYVDKYMYKYRINETSITRSFDSIMDITTFLLLEEFEILFNKLNINDVNYPNYIFRLIIRLVRKYYSHLSIEEFNSKIDLLFDNVIIKKYLNRIDISNLDIYKKELYKIIELKDKMKLYDYMRDVVDKKLLIK